MHFSQSLVSLAAISSLALANPLPEKRGVRFTVPQRTKQVAKLGPVAVRKAYLKYGAAVPEGLHAAAEAAIKAASKTTAANGTGTGTVAAEPAQSGSEYLEAVTVAGTQMNLDFDTGSADLWVYSTLQPSSEQGSHALYKPVSADEIQGATWEIQYGDGSGASGSVYTGTVEIGGVTATSQAIEAATSVSSTFTQDTDNDGLVGLAFSSINTVQPTAQKTFFDNVQGQLESPLFTADLKKDAAGSYDFGFIDTSKYTGDITYADVDDSNGFWQFSADGAEGSSTAFDAILDTGTSLWFLPTDAVTSYYSGVSGAQEDETQGGYVFDCSATLPDATVTIGGTKFTVDGSLLNYAEVGGGQCFGGIQDSTGLPYSIFGDVFLQSVLAVFDSQGPRVGLATQTGGASNSTTGGGSPTSTTVPLPTGTGSSPLPTGTGGFGSGSGSGSGGGFGGFGSGTSSPSPSSSGSSGSDSGFGSPSPSSPSSPQSPDGGSDSGLGGLGGLGGSGGDGGSGGGDDGSGLAGLLGGDGVDGVDGGEDDSGLAALLGQLLGSSGKRAAARKVTTRLGRPAVTTS